MSHIFSHPVATVVVLTLWFVIGYVLVSIFKEDLTDRSFAQFLMALAALSALAALVEWNLVAPMCAAAMLWGCFACGRRLGLKAEWRTKKGVVWQEPSQYQKVADSSNAQSKKPHLYIVRGPEDDKNWLDYSRNHKP